MTDPRESLCLLALLVAGCGASAAPGLRTPEVKATPPLVRALSTPTPRPASPLPLLPVSPTPTPTSTPVAEIPRLQPAAVLAVERLPGPPRPRKGAAGRVEDPSSAASWRSYAESCLKAEAYQEASQAFEEEAKVYRRKGLLQEARAESLKAARYRTEIELFTWMPADLTGRALAPLEPWKGCYVGAFIDRDGALSQHQFGPQRHGDIAEFNQKTGRRHASFFTYLGFHREFPRGWADYVREQGAFPQLAWEPSSLEEVTDEALERAARALEEYGGPVMVRFAGEMNGQWTRYHGDPEAYRNVFRRVARALKPLPNVALMWCPNAIPVDNMASYYPGDEACDWVGVNFYSVPFLDNDPERPGDWIHPIDFLEPVYRQYSPKKPIAIGEYAASLESSLQAGRMTDFARLKLAQLYQSLPLRYPEVKLISWYDCNNLKEARAERQLNNFQLTATPEVLEEYRQRLAQPWFLGSGQRSSPSEARPFPPQVFGPLEIEPWVRSYLPDPQVYLKLDGKVVGLHQLPRGGRYQLPALRPGPHTLELLVYDSRQRFVAARKFAFEVEP